MRIVFGLLPWQLVFELVDWYKTGGATAMYTITACGLMVLYVEEQ